MSRIFTITLVVLVPVVTWLIAPLWSREQRELRPIVPASQALTAAYIGALCRPPDGLETLRWDSRPFDNQEILPQLVLSPEGRRLNEIRHVYVEVLGRDPMDGDCMSLRRWVDGPLDPEQIRRSMKDSWEQRRVARIRQVFIEALGRDPAGWDNSSLRRWADSEFTPVEIRRRLAAQRPMVGVHYFTWYKRQGEEWGNGGTRVQAGTPKPLLGWYGSDDPTVIDRHLEQMVSTGFDFVIVHVNAETPESWTVARRVFDRLPRYGLRAGVMLDGLYTVPAVLKAMWVNKARTEFTSDANYVFLHGKPLVMLYSAALDFSVAGIMLRNVYWTDSYGPGTNTFNATRVLYPRDWPFWAPTPQAIVNGVVPVVPGYVDTHLGRERSMEYPRNDGQMYHDQWRRALSLRPELILVYSWNEYFEQTAIEPTDAWGDRYLRWTSCYVAHAHRGTIGTC